VVEGAEEETFVGVLENIGGNKKIFKKVITSQLTQLHSNSLEST